MPVKNIVTNQRVTKEKLQRAKPEPSMRLLAALGSGMLRDAKAIQDLIRLLNDRTPSVNRAAILALTAIGDKASLEAVASLLLTGSDDIRRSAAEALTNFPEEGYPTLEEGSALEDARVRRAAVYGLARVRQPWAISILKNCTPRMIGGR